MSEHSPFRSRVSENICRLAPSRRSSGFHERRAAVALLIWRITAANAGTTVRSFPRWDTPPQVVKKIQQDRDARDGLRCARVLRIQDCRKALAVWLQIVTTIHAQISQRRGRPDSRWSGPEGIAAGRVVRNPYT